MKNKHLVFLFLGVLAMGVLVRQIPRRYRPFFQTELIKVDTTGVLQCVIQMPGRSELSLQRTENGWLAEQDGRSVAVPAAELAPLLQALAGLHSLRTVKTSQAETLGFSEKNLVQVRVSRQGHLVERFDLGAEIVENNVPATYLRLPMHEGIYLVPGRLRTHFGRTLDDFRSKILVPFDAQTVARFSVQNTENQVFLFEKNDSTGMWETPEGRRLPLDTAREWLLQFSRLNGSTFADQFDESTAEHSRIATIRLEARPAAAVILDFFYLKPPDVPEDLSSLRTGSRKALPTYVVHSSENPANYFAAPDTNLIRYLCFRFR